MLFNMSGFQLSHCEVLVEILEVSHKSLKMISCWTKQKAPLLTKSYNLTFYVSVPSAILFTRRWSRLC